MLSADIVEQVREVAGRVAGTLGLQIFDVQFRREEPGHHARHAHPILVPLVQWAVVMAVWLGLVYREGREKRKR